jgi:hypothetical protein
LNRFTLASRSQEAAAEFPRVFASRARANHAVAYDEKLASRITRATRDWRDCTSKRMFGGVGWLIAGNMCVGIWQDSLIVRCAPSESAKLLAKKHTRVFDLTGRPMKGWLLVAPEGLATAAALAGWLARARAFAESLSPK